MKENVQLVESGLKCDNPKCDWTDMTISHLDYEQYVNYPCPKCGENILTEEDYNMSVIFHSAFDLINGMSEEELSSLDVPDVSIFSAEDNKELKENPEQLFRVSVDLHSGIKMEIKK